MYVLSTTPAKWRIHSDRFMVVCSSFSLCVWSPDCWSAGGLTSENVKFPRESKNRLFKYFDFPAANQISAGGLLQCWRRDLSSQWIFSGSVHSVTVGARALVYPITLASFPSNSTPTVYPSLLLLTGSWGMPPNEKTYQNKRIPVSRFWVSWQGHTPVVEMSSSPDPERKRYHKIKAHSPVIGDRSMVADLPSYPSRL